MTRRSGLGLAIGSLAAIALAGTALAFTGPTNGSFETGTYVDGGSGFEQLNAGDASITGWTVDAGSVDWVGTYWPAQDGSMSIDMSGVAAGTISQTLATTIGNTYTVSFFFQATRQGRHWSRRSTSARRVRPQQATPMNVSGNDRANMNWTQETYTFLATSASTTLTFVSTTAVRVRPGHRQRRHHRNGPHEIRLQGRRLAGDDRQRRQPFQEPGRLRQLLRDGRQELGRATASDQRERNATTTSDVVTSQVKHTTKAHQQATVQHTNRQSGPKNKPNNQAGHRHGSKSK